MKDRFADPGILGWGSGLHCRVFWILDFGFWIAIFTKSDQHVKEQMMKKTVTLNG